MTISESLSEIQDRIDNAVGGREANFYYQTVDLGGGQIHTIPETLQLEGGLTLDLHGSRIRVTEGKSGLSFGTSQDGRALAKCYDGILLGRRGGFNSTISGLGEGLVFQDASRCKVEDVVLSLYFMGVDVRLRHKEQTLYDLTFNDVYVRGCNIGFSIFDANIVKIYGGEVHGERDGEIIKDSVGYHFEGCSGVKLVSPQIQRTELAFLVDRCGQVELENIYTEEIGSGEPGNKHPVGRITDSSNVRITGIINGSHGYSNSNTHCATGLEIHNSQVALFNTRYYQLREADVRVTGDSEVYLPAEEGFWSGTSYSARIPARYQIFDVPVPLKEIEPEDWTVKPSSAFEDQVLTIHSFENDVPLQHFLDISEYDLSEGDTLRVQVRVRLLTANHDSKTGRSVFRLSLGNRNRQARDVDLALYASDSTTFFVDWEVEDSKTKTVFVGLGSRPTQTDPPEVNLFSAEIESVVVGKIQHFELPDQLAVNG